MTLTNLNYLNLVITLETLVAVHMMAFYLPKRNPFPLRVVVSSVLCLTAGLLFYVPWLHNLALNILYAIFMYSMLAVLAGIAVWACRKMSLWEFLFCVSGGHALHQLAGQIRSFLVKVTQIEMMEDTVYHTLDIVIWIAALLVVYAVFFFYFVLRKKINKDISLQKHKVILLILAVILINIVLSSCLLFMGQDIDYGLSLVISGYNLISVTLEIFVLFSFLTEKRMENELQTINALLNKGAKQYELSKQNIDMINIKCHDIRHRIDQLSEGNDYFLASGLQELKETISIYDSVIKTGNDVLDVVLTEHSLYCEKNGITFSVIADGALLKFISPYDLYCLFDNAIYNAIEAVMKTEDPAQRSISLTIKGNDRIASVHIENYFVGQLTKDGNEILTQKPDEANHGFGTKSMRAIVEKYNGTISFSSEDNIFLLDMLFPL